MLLPLDDRPCCLDFPRQLAAVAGFELKLPPRELLGRFLVPGSPRELSLWLKSSTADNMSLVISLDMLAYGGLVASRKHMTGLEEALENLRDIPGLRDAKDRFSIHAFQALMRSAPTAASPEEAELAGDIGKYSMLRELVRREYSREKMEELRETAGRIPEGDLMEYLMTRERNHLLNTRMLYWVKDGYLDHLSIGLDDVLAGGMSTAERRILETLAEFLKLEKRVAFHPGTDEIGLLLLARAVCDIRKVSPAFHTVYSRPDYRTIVPRYEDESLETIVERQIEVAGGRPVPDQESADIFLFVHVPPGEQKEAVFQPVSGVADEDLADFIEALSGALVEGKECALADTAYANGADRLMISRLRKDVPIHLLSSFSAWNTAANTLGTAVAQGILRWTGKQRLRTEELSMDEALGMEKEQISFLFSRLLDDWAYQSLIREKVRNAVLSAGMNPLNLGEGADWVAGMVSDCLRESGKQLFEEHFMGKKVRLEVGTRKYTAAIGPLVSIEASLPWNRLFEISLHPSFDMHA
jgi:hypothetical protein